MKEYYDDYPVNDEGSLNIDFSKFKSRLKGNKKVILRWTLISAVIGVLVAISIPRRYSVLTKLAPELTNNTVNRLSSLSQLAGLNSTMLGTTDAIYPMVYPDIVNSPEFIVDLFDTPVTFKCKKEIVDTTLYEYLLNNQRSSVIGIVMSAPFRLIGWVKGWFVPEEETDPDKPVDPFHLTREQYQVSKMIRSGIEATIDKKTMVVSIVVTMQDPMVAAQASKAVNENLQKYVTAYRTEKAKRDVAYYKKLFNEAKAEYEKAQNRYARHVDLNHGIVMQRARVEEERLQNEANLHFVLYNNLAQQLQTAEAKVQQATPAFVEIISPTVPIRPAKPSRKTIVLLVTILGFMASCAVVALRKEK
ncbi:MAG: chain-length determining protein [Bacteroidales bacterium]|nr:chain-length determining protein [Bacteroidales bacterium]